MCSIQVLLLSQSTPKTIVLVSSSTDIKIRRSSIENLVLSLNPLERIVLVSSGTAMEADGSPIKRLLLSLNPFKSFVLVSPGNVKKTGKSPRPCRCLLVIWSLLSWYHDSHVYISSNLPLRSYISKLVQGCILRCSIQRKVAVSQVRFPAISGQA